MHGYQIALFLHLVALFAAFGASTVVHVAMGRIRSARSGGAALEWLGVAHSLSRVFPIALAALVGTGAWMLHSSWSWSAGFVDAGLTGVVLLFVSGAAIESTRAGALAAALAAAPHEPFSAETAARTRDPLWWCASWSNSGIAVAVAFVMVVKPSPAASFAALAVGIAAGCAVGLLSRRTPVPTVPEGVTR
jgi:hypothetical protein